MDQKQSKKILSALRLQKHEERLACPICQKNMHIANRQSLICKNNHTFDIARQGYVHLLTRSAPTNYEQALFQARRKIIQTTDLYTPMITEIFQQLTAQPFTKERPYIIDMGTGEGSHLQHLKQKYASSSKGNPHFFGIDVAKEGILEATKLEEEIVWLVADLAKSPFIKQSFDIILNILSPANYEEFKRLLSPQGSVLKVIPGEKYLREIRDYFYRGEKQQTYSNEDVMKGFMNHFSNINHTNIRYKKKLDEEQIRALLQMTPLTWNSPSQEIESFLAENITEITIHLEILIGMVK